MNNQTIKVAIVTGPTGGHFFPGLAIGEQLREKGKDVFFFIPDRTYITRWLEQKGFPYKVMPEVKITIKNPLFLFKLIYLTILSCNTLLIKQFNLVVITGSYTSLPFLLASFFCNKKTFVHEQNFLYGRFTKFSSFIANKIGLSFPQRDISKRGNTVITGFPIPQDFKKRHSRNDVLEEFGLTEDKTTVLVFGGSQGALFLNTLITENMDYLSKKNLQFIHIAGKDNEIISKKYKMYNIKAKVFDFYFDMAKLYNITDLTISRAGAGTLAEICEWLIPAIVIPYPYAGGHQKHNALYFAQQGGCYILEQNQDSIKSFAGIFERTLDNSDILKQQLEKLSIVDTAGNNVSEILRLFKNGT
ncbi:MAG: UDP-N-acetylglucosamine--N-acetylmuramyl-(pentapeptide) pyrophosphoryl-undecaprenol N-acetylglucosamine transferase [Elusimicrobia bacterium]|nr:UDP-N-acetylglucosamine--N-acetylmuramyl-(pentapeptide) pyrophosphoryl-undecaprenol N-acetylglucosamine transferase [Elusimicrobiota bacterium]